jgi:hypothetical protein
MKTVLILALLTASASAQTWQKVATEGQSVTFSNLPITVRFGAAQNAPTSGGALCVTAGGCWTAPLVIAGGPTVTAVANLSLFAATKPVTPDPIVYTVKELDVLETAVAQTVTVAGKVVTVPATGVVAPPPPPTTVVYLLNGPITLTYTPATGNFTLTGTGTAAKQ